MVAPSLLLVLLLLGWVEGTRIASSFIRQGPDCTGAMLVAVPIMPSGTCVQVSHTLSYKITCGLNTSSQYLCEDMVAPIKLMLGTTNCSITSAGNEFLLILDVGVCRPMINLVDSYVMPDSYKVVKSAGKYILNYYKDNTACQDTFEQLPATAPNTCEQDASLTTWKSVRVEEVQDDGTMTTTLAPSITTCVFQDVFSQTFIWDCVDDGSSCNGFRNCRFDVLTLGNKPQYTLHSLTLGWSGAGFGSITAEKCKLLPVRRMVAADR
ncbi:hypothetical protein BASA81_002145 [Batrachochytrium salamandrivorans]|nr:hypothetical protein BASA81_002145 [Batrachochytrium salamandrivorans]